jgi:hypothetical protein
VGCGVCGWVTSRNCESLTLPDLAGHPWIPSNLESLVGCGGNGSQSALARGEPRTQRARRVFLVQPSAQLAARPSRSNKLFEMGRSTDQPGPRRAGHNIRRRKQSVGQIWPSGQGGIFRGDVNATGDGDVCRRFQCPQRAIGESKGGMAAIDSGDVIQISRLLGISEFEAIGRRRSQQAWNARFARQGSGGLQK